MANSVQHIGVDFVEKFFTTYKLQKACLQMTKLVQNAYDINPERIIYMSNPMLHV